MLRYLPIVDSARVEVSITNAGRCCAWPVGVRRARTGPARFGRCRPAGVDAWLLLWQQQSRLPPLSAAAARLCFVFESHFHAICSDRRWPALPDVFSGYRGRSRRFAAISVFGCSFVSAMIFRYRWRSTLVVSTMHSALFVGAIL